MTDLRMTNDREIEDQLELLSFVIGRSVICHLSSVIGRSVIDGRLPETGRLWMSPSCESVPGGSA
jgi:hypothetical protein